MTILRFSIFFVFLIPSVSFGGFGGYGRVMCVTIKSVDEGIAIPSRVMLFEQLNTDKYRSDDFFNGEYYEDDWTISFKVKSIPYERLVSNHPQVRSMFSSYNMTRGLRSEPKNMEKMAETFGQLAPFVDSMPSGDELSANEVEVESFGPGHHLDIDWIGGGGHDITCNDFHADPFCTGRFNLEAGRDLATLMCHRISDRMPEQKVITFDQTLLDDDDCAETECELDDTNSTN